jgi:hypothetical protein
VETLGHLHWLDRSNPGGGGDQGDFGEMSAHPKPSGDGIQLGLLELSVRTMSHVKITSMRKGGQSSESNADGHDRREDLTKDGNMRQGDKSGWAIEVYKQKGSGYQEEEQEELLELDLDIEEEEIAKKFLAIVVYYSRKSYNAKYVFEEMLHAWGISSMG